MKLVPYKGNYSAFEDTRRDRYVADMRRWKKQEDDIAHKQEFVDKVGSSREREREREREGIYPPT
jgi:ATPase subunit of ABC transporter with duplicated ATPase domains